MQTSNLYMYHPTEVGGGVKIQMRLRRSTSYIAQRDEEKDPNLYAFFSPVSFFQ